MILTDYTFYATEFYGNMIKEEDFNRLASKASADIMAYTRNKATRENDAVQRACCALAEQYAIIDKAEQSAISGEVASETVGAWSRTYRNGAETAAAARSEITQIMRSYLAPTGLLYRGGCCCVSSHCDRL